MLRVPFTKVGPSPVAPHFRDYTTPYYRHPTTKIVIARFVRSEFNCGLLKGREFLVDVQAVENHPSRTIRCFIPIKDKADWAARLNRDYLINTVRHLEKMNKIILVSDLILLM